MQSGAYPWSEGHCIRADGKWYFVRGDGSWRRIFIENENMVVDSDHLEWLVVEALKNDQLVGLN
jgi:hypothetical protein